MVADARRTAGVLLLGAFVLCGPAPAAAAGSAPTHPDPRLCPPDTLSARDVAFRLRYGAPVRPAHRDDRWLGRDKAKHVAFSTLWTLSTQYVLVKKIGWTKDRALPASVASGAAIGLTKEVYDARQPDRDASGKDLVANAIGIGLAAGIILL